MASQDPIKTVKKAAPVALTLTAVLYMLCNIAYFAAGTQSDLFVLGLTNPLILVAQYPEKIS